jgi:hypothetical protein
MGTDRRGQAKYEVGGATYDYEYVHEYVCEYEYDCECGAHGECTAACPSSAGRGEANQHRDDPVQERFAFTDVFE